MKGVGEDLGQELGWGACVVAGRCSLFLPPSCPPPAFRDQRPTIPYGGGGGVATRNTGPYIYIYILYYIYIYIYVYDRNLTYNMHRSKCQVRLGKNEPAVVDVFPGIPKGGVGFARKILTPTRFTVLRNALLLDEVSPLIHCPNRAALLRPDPREHGPRLRGACNDCLRRGKQNRRRPWPVMLWAVGLPETSLPFFPSGEIRGSWLTKKLVLRPSVVGMNRCEIQLKETGVVPILIPCLSHRQAKWQPGT